MKYVNLTPHEVVIMNFDKQVVRRVPKSGLQARLDTDWDLRSTGKDGVMLFDIFFGEPVLLDAPGSRLPFPVQEPGTIFIVSAMFADNMPRGDLWSPGEQVRDGDGTIIGCIGLNQKVVAGNE